MRLYSYVVRYDFGFAPNPFHEFCTLATCKPQIRKTASVGDWVVGTGSAENGLSGRLVYGMKISETLDFASYWNDERFKKKRPYLSGSLVQAFGDNIYHMKDGCWHQEESRHRQPGSQTNERHLTRDLGGVNVLISREFAYWGKAAVKIPTKFRNWNGHDLCQRRGYKYKFPSDMVDAFASWFRGKKTDVVGEPSGFDKLIA